MFEVIIYNILYKHTHHIISQKYKHTHREGIYTYSTSIYCHVFVKFIVYMYIISIL